MKDFFVDGIEPTPAGRAFVEEFLKKGSKKLSFGREWDRIESYWRNNGIARVSAWVDFQLVGHADLDSSHFTIVPRKLHDYDDYGAEIEKNDILKAELQAERELVRNSPPVSEDEIPR